MASGSNRDVSLNLGVTTTGTDALAKVGAELTALKNRTEELRAAENAQNAEVTAAKRALESQREELARLRLSYQAAGGDADKYKADVLQLKTAILDSRAALRDKQSALTSAGIASRTAAAAERDLAAEVTRASEAQRQQAAATGAVNTRLATQGRADLASLGADLQRIQSLAAVAVGGTVLTSLIGDLAQTADGYKDLAARIKLSTGEGALFNSAFEGVFDVATRTNSAVAETGQLFTKLNDAGKLLGLTQADALKLTETVNQSIQLSGGSADSAKAAIVQLVQGLQSGVLRGDEFNSVMEQSPRLAKALADGLGVTTAALRTQAEAGRLTSEVVITSLTKQADTVATEFAKLPPTVGKALQNLSTEWTRYVGSAAEGSGATTTAAKAIDLLAGNLTTVAGLLIDAGQAAAAFKVVNLAASFLGIGQAAQQSAIKVATSTAALQANALASGEVSAASATAGANVGRFAAALSTIKAFSAVAIIANYKDIGTAIGEGIAKLVGYKDRTDELARAEKMANEISQDGVKLRRDQRAAIEAAINAQFELSKAAADSIAKFDDLVKKGDSANEAIGKIGKDFDLSKVPGIRDAATVLDKLTADGKISAAELQAAYSNALKGEDLGLFEARARAAFAGATREAERLAQALEGSTREAIKRTGLDFDVISGGMGKASKSAINDTQAIILGLDSLRTKGVDTAQALTASIGKGISTADSQAAIKAVTDQIEGLRKTLGDRLTDGLLDQAKQKADQLKDSLDKARPGIDSLREAFAELGLKSSADLQRIADKSKEAYTQITRDGTVSAATKAEAFRVYADKAIAANNGVASEALKVEANMRGLEIQADGTGKTIVSAMGSGSRAVDSLGQRVQATTEDLKKQADALDKLNAKYAKPSSNRDKVDSENPFGKTSDGFKANKDGSAAGTFTNGLPVDVAFAVNARSAAGKLTAADLGEAQAGFEQARKAKEDMDAFIKLAPGAASTAYIQSTNALFTASRIALDKVLAMTNSQIGLRTATEAQAAPTTPTTPTNGRQAPGQPVPPPPPKSAQEVANDQARAAGIPTGQANDPLAVARANQAAAGPVPVTRTVTININGVGTNIAVGGDADANALESVIRQLTNAKRTSI